MTSGWMHCAVDAMLFAVLSRPRKSAVESTAIRRAIGHGFATSLPTAKMPRKLTRELASRRSDKPNPLYYAQRTVDVASARLWLIEGIAYRRRNHDA